jgi:hypothetical protein
MSGTRFKEMAKNLGKRLPLGKKLEILEISEDEADRQDGIALDSVVQRSLMPNLVSSTEQRVTATAFQITLSNLEALEAADNGESTEARIPSDAELKGSFFGVFGHQLAFFYLLIQLWPAYESLRPVQRLDMVNTTMAPRDREVLNFIISYFTQLNYDFSLENIFFLLEIWKERKEFLIHASPDQAMLRTHEAWFDQEMMKKREEIWFNTNQYTKKLNKIFEALKTTPLLQSVLLHANQTLLEESVMMYLYDEAGNALQVFVRLDALWKTDEGIVVADYKFGKEPTELSKSNGYELVQLLLMMVAGALITNEKMDGKKLRKWSEKMKSVHVHVGAIPILIQSVSLFYLVLVGNQFQEKEMTLRNEYLDVGVVNLDILMQRFKSQEARNEFQRRMHQRGNIEIVPPSSLQPHRLSPDRLFQPLLGETHVLSRKT